MLLSAMFLNPVSGIPPQVIVLAIGVTGMAIGFLWIRRITGDDEARRRSFWRSLAQESRGPQLPSLRVERPTAGWIATRVGIVLAIGSVAVALAGPVILGRWARPFDESPGLAAGLWVVAIVAALAGTAWMLRIATRSPEHGRSAWRSRQERHGSRIGRRSIR